MKVKVNDRVKLLGKLLGNPGAEPGILGTVVSINDKSGSSFTVQWDKPGLFKNAFSGEIANKFLVED